MTIADADHLCGCVCNHSGACTGCGICCVQAYREDQERQIRALFFRGHAA